MRLLVVELRRLAARRFVRWGTLAIVAGLALLVGVTALQSRQPTAAERATAATQAERYAAEAARERERCEQTASSGATEPERPYPPGFDCARIVGPDADDLLTVYQFDFRDEMRDRSVLVVVVLTLFGFLLGATAVGAEWHYGTMGALLLFEPRRLRVYLAKLTAVVLGVLGIGAAVAGASIGGHYLVGVTRGELGALTTGFWSSLVLLQGRGLLAATSAALVGFAIAFTLRYTAAALGAILGYAALGEIALRIWSQRSQVGLLSTNMQAWLYRRAEVTIFDCPPAGECRQETLVVSMWQGGALLAGIALLAVVVAAFVFRRRDVP
jgi:ABC-type transport system involved in multi-copper enzyme maturation permease subunit